MNDPLFFSQPSFSIFIRLKIQYLVWGEGRSKSLYFVANEMPEIDIPTYRDKLLLTDICLYASKLKNVWKVGSIGGHPN